MRDLIPFGAKDYYMAEVNDGLMLDHRCFLQKKKQLEISGINILKFLIRLILL